ncbi:hypothetical protein GCM10010361_57910 [Streptomyces olivaceiscleroticus]|uniref:SPDY domain containing protein n=2 Tax=Streptomyces olivaceiscleroticus TaxID=68245 RepID=A0ABN1AXF8_9ACTN
MGELTAEQSPDDMAEELRGLGYVDWPAVWSGPPMPGPSLDDWCALFSWRPISVERVLRVRTMSGTQLVLQPVRPGGWSPVSAAEYTVWHLTAGSPEEDELVLEEGAAAWSEYVAAARGVLGEPVFAGSWNDPDFPEPPDEWHWLTPSEPRLKRRNPYRMAMWRSPDPEGPVTELSLRHGGKARSGAGRRGVMVILRCHPRDNQELH